MKWVVLVVVVILVAPTLANRLQELNPDNADKRANSAAQKRRGIVYRAVRRFGPRRVFGVSVLVLAVLAVAAYVLVRAA
ncbi:MAG: hypothetical protein E6G57_14370 [Actinobacteria bacterium]|nr:MAG: hypothetical protein E6G57_14370 [Actinomycetota bacterium]